MYIPEFWAGVITTIGVEFAILIIIAGLGMKKRQKKNIDCIQQLAGLHSLRFLKVLKNSSMHKNIRKNRHQC